MIANLESNENHVFYWVYEVGYEGVLLRGLDWYGTVGTGFGAGTGAGTVQVRYGYRTCTGTIGTVRVRYTWVPTFGAFQMYGTLGTWVPCCCCLGSLGPF